MDGLAAAPDMATAVPRVIPPPYSEEGRKPTLVLPQCKGVTVNDAALRCCQARRLPATRLSVRLTTWKGRFLMFNAAIFMLSLSAKPVNWLAFRSWFEAPKYARIKRSRYIPWSENLLMFT